MMSTLQACVLLTAYSLIKHFERCARSKCAVRILSCGNSPVVPAAEPANVSMPSQWESLH